MSKEVRKVIFFDGVCNLCNGVVDFVMKNNKQRDVYYSSLQSDYARKFLSGNHLNAANLNTIYFYTNGQLYSHSTAILKILKNTTWPYSFLASAFLLINKHFRDTVYRLIAKHRYTIWGKSNTCRLPTASEKMMFIE